MNCDNRRMVEFGATTAPQNAAKTLLNRYVERASIAWHVTEFASRRVSCINYLTVWRVCTQELWKKKKTGLRSRELLFRGVNAIKKTQRVFSNRWRKVRYSHVFVESANNYSRPSNESTKARNDVNGRSLSSATPSEYPCPECGISTLLLSHRAPFSYKVRPRNIFFYYTLFFI